VPLVADMLTGPIQKYKTFNFFPTSMTVHLFIIILNCIYLLADHEGWQKYGQSASAFIAYNFVDQDLGDFNGND